jgi:hypothetical protein
LWNNGSFGLLGYKQKGGRGVFPKAKASVHVTMAS